MRKNAISPDSEAAHACEECGKPDAVQIADRWLCIDCYTGHGSCCPEFGADDLWAEHEKSESKKPRE